MDLSDDMVVMDLFGDGKWESSLEQLLNRENDEVLFTEEQFLKMTV